MFTDYLDPDLLYSLDVDHIKDFDLHPELALDIDILSTLCLKCNNIKHYRFLF
ncbi:HNH endonuclease [Listeria monocytogenes]|uniref:HNH endonuclease n=1 Tax=Listeria monocytogenes TaxID=1639 RepID=UPI00325FBA9F